MRIVTLVENSEGAPGCRFEHGLSCYIESGNHKVLLDSGASDAILTNAEATGIDLSAVDTIFLSHGHLDHSGGLMPLQTVNSTAPIYMQKLAAEDYFKKVEGEEKLYIGIDKAILDLPQTRLMEGDYRVDEFLSVFSGITGRRFFSKSNFTLKAVENGKLVEDPFRHEQCLVVEEDGRYYLFSGCAHNGMLNILDRFREIYGCEPDVAVSGFHFMKPADYTAEEIRIIEETARELAKMKTVFYTGHCTSLPAYYLMKPIMGNKLHQIHSGLEISLD